jgi:hypothetical protein
MTKWEQDWQRLTNNLYVIDGRIQRARADIEALENQRGQILRDLDVIYKAEHSSAGEKP